MNNRFEKKLSFANFSELHILPLILDKHRIDSFVGLRFSPVFFSDSLQCISVWVVFLTEIFITFFIRGYYVFIYFSNKHSCKMGHKNMT